MSDEEPVEVAVQFHRTPLSAVDGYSVSGAKTCPICGCLLGENTAQHRAWHTKDTPGVILVDADTHPAARYVYRDGKICPAHTPPQ